VKNITTGADAVKLFPVTINAISPPATIDCSSSTSSDTNYVKVEDDTIPEMMPSSACDSTSNTNNLVEVTPVDMEEDAELDAELGGFLLEALGDTPDYDDETYAVPDCSGYTDLELLCSSNERL